MPKGKKVDRTLVESIKEAVKKYPTMPIGDVSRLCGVSESTVSRVLSGVYDHMLDEPAGAADVGELERLVSEANVYLRTMAFAMLAEMDSDVKVTHDMCTRWRKNMEFDGYRRPADSGEPGANGARGLQRAHGARV